MKMFKFPYLNICLASMIKPILTSIDISNFPLLIRTPLGSVELRAPLGRGGFRPPPCDLPKYWADFQNSNAIR